MTAAGGGSAPPGGGQEIGSWASRHILATIRPAGSSGAMAAFRPARWLTRSRRSTSPAAPLREESTLVR
jgi:hypothetical protein